MTMATSETSAVRLAKDVAFLDLAADTLLLLRPAIDAGGLGFPRPGKMQPRSPREVASTYGHFINCIQIMFRFSPAAWPRHSNELAAKVRLPPSSWLPSLMPRLDPGPPLPRQGPRRLRRRHACLLPPRSPVRRPLPPHALRQPNLPAICPRLRARAGQVPVLQGLAGAGGAVRRVRRYGGRAAQVQEVPDGGLLLRRVPEGGVEGWAQGGLCRGQDGGGSRGRGAGGGGLRGSFGGGAASVGDTSRLVLFLFIQPAPAAPLCLAGLDSPRRPRAQQSLLPDRPSCQFRPPKRSP
ncbi:hypothetical protein DFJ74DRAFT_501124 [Hyaloraphidium curvatum]|nr:hypothetical protein DFJ74DRAFT_501124 [Hyaloraphidium curvatum]